MLACSLTAFILRRLECLQHLPTSTAQFVSDERGELAVLGTGAHAVIYLALLNGRRVAVKVRFEAVCNNEGTWHMHVIQCPWHES